jgi:phosphoribosylformylglycinamidine synthase subunit PurS
LIVAKVVVDVMLKPEILDPQGQAIERALPTLGFDQVSNVRQGKHFELEITESDAQALAEKIASTLLANPVIEDFTIGVVQTG